ncbi:MAG TPA: hypothetical protein VGI47_00040 [Candidatus Binataceae bacterium]
MRSEARTAADGSRIHSDRARHRLLVADGGKRVVGYAGTGS